MAKKKSGGQEKSTRSSSYIIGLALLLMILIGGIYSSRYYKEQQKIAEMELLEQQEIAETELILSQYGTYIDKFNSLLEEYNVLIEEINMADGQRKMLLIRDHEKFLQEADPVLYEFKTFIHWNHAKISKTGANPDYLWWKIDEVEKLMRENKAIFENQLLLLTMGQASTPNISNGITLNLNHYELLDQIGEIPPEQKSLMKYLDSEQQENVRAAYIKTPANGNKFIVLDMTITNLNLGEACFLMDVEIKDPGGYMYSFLPVTFNLNDHLQNSCIKQNERLSGKMVYEIPANLKDFELIVNYDREGSSATYSKGFSI